MRFLQPFLAAVVTFTRIPIPWTLEAAAFRRASLQLPLLGWFLGGLQWLILSLGAWIPADVALFLALLIPILLSGAMHEDGLADFADGILGGATIERRLEIMKDPRVGSFGVLALILVLGGQFLFLSHTAESLRGPLLLGVAVLSRCLCVLLLGALPYKNHSGSRSQGFLPENFTGWKTLLPLWPALPMGCLWPMSTSVAMGIGLLLLFFGLKSYLQKKLEGVTGDCLGAAIKLAEFCFFLIACCLSMH